MNSNVPSDIRICAVVAVARNGVIGKDGTLPWRMRDDLKWFKEITFGKPVIMGRTTFEDLGKPLPGRQNIVLSRQNIDLPEGVILAHNVPEAIAHGLKAAQTLQAAEVCVIGGAQIYRELMPYLSRLYITHIEADIDGDTWLEMPDKAEWFIETLRVITADDRNDHDAIIEQWDREQEI